MVITAMKQKLQAGSDIDFLTSDEMKALLAPIQELLWLSEQFDVFDIEYSAQANGAGAFISQNLYTVPVGYMVQLHRIEVNAPGITAAAPLNPAGAQVGFFLNDPTVISNQFLFLPVGGTIAPLVLTEGSRSAKSVKGGSQIYIAGTGFAANQVLYFRIQTQLTPGPRKIKK